MRLSGFYRLASGDLPAAAAKDWKKLTRVAATVGCRPPYVCISPRGTGPQGKWSRGNTPGRPKLSRTVLSLREEWAEHFEEVFSFLSERKL